MFKYSHTEGLGLQHMNSGLGGTIESITYINWGAEINLEYLKNDI